MDDKFSFEKESDARRVYRGLRTWYEEHKAEYCGNPLNYVYLEKKKILVSNENVRSILEEIVNQMGFELKNRQGDKRSSKRKTSKMYRLKKVVV